MTEDDFAKVQHLTAACESRSTRINLIKHQAQPYCSSQKNKKKKQEEDSEKSFIFGHGADLNDNNYYLTDKIHSSDIGNAKADTQKLSLDNNEWPLNSWKNEGVFDAISTLRRELKRSSKPKIHDRLRCPTGISDEALIEFTIKVYGDDITDGSFTPGDLSREDRRLYDALHRLAKKQNSSRTVSDIFDDLGFPSRTSNTDRLSAVAVVLGCTETEAVNFFRGFRVEHAPDHHPKVRGPYARQKDAVIPEKPPALWREDRLPGETPTGFIEKWYGEWLGKGMVRADLLRLDRTLYFDLSNWLRKNEMPENINLPTIPNQTERKI